MAAANIVAHAEAVAGFVGQLGSPGAAKVLEAQRHALASMLAGATLSVAEASAVVAAIKKVPFSEGDRPALLTMVVDRSSGHPGAVGRSKLQDFGAISSCLSSTE